MTRKKITLAYIANNADRKASYNKRKKGLIKKVRELSILCDVQACAVIASSFDKEPEVWPSREAAVALYASLQDGELPGGDQAKKVINQEDFIRQQISKVNDKVARLQRENNRREVDIFMHMCIAGKARVEDFNFSRRSEMNRFIDQRKREIDSMLEGLRIQADSSDRPRPSNPSG